MIGTRSTAGSAGPRTRSKPVACGIAMSVTTRSGVRESIARAPRGRTPPRHFGASRRSTPSRARARPGRRPRRAHGDAAGVRQGFGPWRPPPRRRRHAAILAPMSGSRTVNVEPCVLPGLSAVTVPPCSSTRCRTRDRPRPRPPCSRVTSERLPAGSARRRAAGTPGRCPRPCRSPSARRRRPRGAA